MNFHINQIFRAKSGVEKIENNQEGIPHYTYYTSNHNEEGSSANISRPMF